MSTTDTSREAFKTWHLNKFDVLRPDIFEGGMPQGFRWEAWQAALEWQAAKATGTAGEIDADAEMAKVKRDVELMGVGFLVDGKRCSLDRITWFNRPGDTWLPPPPGYPVQEALQPMTMSYVQNVPDQCDRITWRGAYYHLKEGAEAARQPAPVVSNDLRNAAQLIMDLYDDMRMGKQAIPAFDALRAALEATAAPVLSDEQMHCLRDYCRSSREPGTGCGG